MEKLLHRSSSSSSTWAGILSYRLRITIVIMQICSGKPSQNKIWYSADIICSFPWTPLLLNSTDTSWQGSMNILYFYSLAKAIYIKSDLYQILWKLASSYSFYVTDFSKTLSRLLQPTVVACCCGWWHPIPWGRGKQMLIWHQCQVIRY